VLESGAGNTRPASCCLQDMSSSGAAQQAGLGVCPCGKPGSSDPASQQRGEARRGDVNGALILWWGLPRSPGGEAGKASGLPASPNWSPAEPPALVLLCGSEGLAMAPHPAPDAAGVPSCLNIETDSIGRAPAAVAPAGRTTIWLSRAVPADLLLRRELHLRWRSHPPLRASSQLQVAILPVDYRRAR